LAGLSLVLLLVHFGCGRGPEMAPVSGRITVGGQPVERGSVLFVPDGSGTAAAANIEPGGAYVLRTGLETQGAAVGRYRVGIGGRGLDDPEALPPNRVLHPRYANPRRSGLTAEVKPGPNEINFDLKP
jgi:hypothetical protein